MLANDQIKLVAQEINETADERIHESDDRVDRQQLWEVVRRACKTIETVVELEDDVPAADLRKQARYVIGELESALESARKAESALDRQSEREQDGYSR